MAEKIFGCDLASIRWWTLLLKFQISNNHIAYFMPVEKQEPNTESLLIGKKVFLLVYYTHAAE